MHGHQACPGACEPARDPEDLCYGRAHAPEPFCAVDLACAFPCLCPSPFPVSFLSVGQGHFKQAEFSRARPMRCATHGPSKAMIAALKVHGADAPGRNAPARGARRGRAGSRGRNPDRGRARHAGHPARAGGRAAGGLVCGLPRLALPRGLAGEHPRPLAGNRGSCPELPDLVAREGVPAADAARRLSAGRAIPAPDSHARVVNPLRLAADASLGHALSAYT